MITPTLGKLRELRTEVCCSGSKFYDMEPLARPPYIRTVTGVAFPCEKPTALHVRILDIIYSLSRAPRYTGYTKGNVPYTVGQHVVLCSEYVTELDGSPPDYQLRRNAFGHDWTEAYVTDLASPYKRMPGFKVYRDTEDDVALAIGQAFGISHIVSPEVKLVDARALHTEARALMPGWAEQDFAGLPPPWYGYDGYFPVWSIERTKYEMCRLYTELFEGNNRRVESALLNDLHRLELGERV